MTKTKSLLFLISCICFYSNAQISPKEYWQDSVLPYLHEKNNIQFKISQTVFYDDGTFWKYSPTCFDVAPPRYIGMDSNEFMIYVSKDSLKLVDLYNGNLSYGSRYSDTTVQDTAGEIMFDMYAQIRNSYLHNIQRYAWFYFYPEKRDTLFLDAFYSIRDTVISGIRYKELGLTYLGGYSRHSDKEEWKAFYDTLHLYCNTNDHLVKTIHYASSNFPGGSYDFEFTDFTFHSDNRWDSLFDFNHPRYKDFIAYNFQTDPAPSECGRWCANIQMNDSVRHCPLEASGGETVYLKDFKEWKLLDFWHFGCKACAFFHRDLQKERDSLGYRILEREGIRLFCINYEGGRTGKFCEYAEHFGIPDIAYASRDISRFISIPHFPYFYLFSPSGELVYRGDLDYAAILKAKQNYEKNPKKQIKKAIQCEHSLY